MTKPKVTTNPVANQYAGPNERIIEYSHKGLGGLIAFRQTEDGNLRVDLYRHDEGVQINTGQAPKVEIVHGRDPDSECGLTVFLNGESVKFTEEDIDPGRGYTREDWDERIRDAEEDTTSSPAFKEAVLSTLEAYSGNKYIVGED